MIGIQNDHTHMYAYFTEYEYLQKLYMYLSNMYNSDQHARFFYELISY